MYQFTQYGFICSISWHTHSRILALVPFLFDCTSCITMQRKFGHGHIYSKLLMMIIIWQRRMWMLFACIYIAATESVFSFCKLSMRWRDQQRKWQTHTQMLYFCLILRYTRANCSIHISANYNIFVVVRVSLCTDTGWQWWGASSCKSNNDRKETTRRKDFQIWI